MECGRTQVWTPDRGYRPEPVRWHRHYAGCGHNGKDTAMSQRVLARLGIDDPVVRSSYLACKRLNSEHGKTYYLAALLLPADRRPFIHALYGLARYADDIVDSLTDQPVAQRKQVLADLAGTVETDLVRGQSAHPIAAAAVDTATRFGIPWAYFQAFFDSMAMDLEVTRYQTYDDLLAYTYGSAAVIGLQMVPILGGTQPPAYTHAAELGVAFQLANFIRDVGEDTARGRIYLPLDELAQFGVRESDVLDQRLTPDLRQALRFQINRVRNLQESAAKGLPYLDAAAQPCIRTASTLYCGIVDEVVRNDYDVFTKRATVPLRRRFAVAVPAFADAWRSRHR